MRKFRNFLLFVVVSYLFALVYIQSDAYRYPGYAVLDFFTRLELSLTKTSREKWMANNPIVVIPVDEDSYQKLELQWPWSREVFSLLLEKLALHKPRVVALDFGFYGKSANGQSDEKLVLSLGKLPQVITATVFDDQGIYREPFKEIMELKNVHGGFINVPISKDGVTRNSYVVAVDPQGKIIAPSFALGIAMAYRGDKKMDALTRPLWGMPFSAVRISARDGSSKIIEAQNDFITGTHYFLKPFDFPRVPFWKALADDKALEIVRDKIVIVGVEANLFQDIHKSPFGYVPGYAIQAVNTAMFLAGGPIVKAPRIFSILLLMISVFVASSFLVTTKREVAISVASLLFLFSFLVSLYLFLVHHVFVDPVVSMLGTFGLVLMAIIYEDGSKLVEIIQLKNQASHDPLTKTYNFGYFKLAVNVFLRKMNKGDHAALIIFDVDHFKEINDTYGHPMGNEILIYFSSLLQKNARRDDVVARFGGDEFTVLLNHSSKPVTEKYLERIMSGVTNRLPQLVKMPDFSFSAGAVVASKGRFDNVDAFMEAADKILYESKRGGRSQFRVVEV